MGGVTVLAPRRRILDSAPREKLDARLATGAADPALSCVSVDVAESVCSSSAEVRRLATLRSNDALLARKIESEAGRPRSLRPASSSLSPCSAASNSAIDRFDEWATSTGCGADGGVAAGATAVAAKAPGAGAAAPGVAPAPPGAAAAGSGCCEARGRAATAAGAPAGNDSEEPTGIGAPNVGGADMVTLNVLHVRAAAAQQLTLRLLVWSESTASLCHFQPWLATRSAAPSPSTSCISRHSSRTLAPRARRWRTSADSCRREPVCAACSRSSQLGSFSACAPPALAIFLRPRRHTPAVLRLTPARAGAASPAHTAQATLQTSERRNRAADAERPGAPAAAPAPRRRSDSAAAGALECPRNKHTCLPPTPPHLGEMPPRRRRRCRAPWRASNSVSGPSALRRIAAQRQRAASGSAT